MSYWFEKRNYPSVQKKPKWLPSTGYHGESEITLLGGLAVESLERGGESMGMLLGDNEDSNGEYCEKLENIMPLKGPPHSQGPLSTLREDPGDEVAKGAKRIMSDSSTGAFKFCFLHGIN